ncbi:hypothetical protein AGLY_017670 [Aphis glycines]|uniref:Uncharacterized protein n=1 Tax=Aphis glycines TaxID=307491 RepID=A0A6G0SU81_APHGL|nr:hypothetical protein AGLY_017670 [Aphis glycines]
MVKGTAKRYIPRGFRHKYIPCWNEESNRLYTEYQRNGQAETADKLLGSLAKGRKDRWTETVERIDFKHSSREAWNVLRRLDPSQNRGDGEPEIKPNAFANRLIETSIAKIDKDTSRKLTMASNNIAPPKIRREQALIREWTKIKNNKNLPVHADVRINADRLRLKSRKPPWKTAEMLLLENTGENTKWFEDWMAENPDVQNIVTNPTSKQPGFDLPRKIWVTLNRIRTGHGRCNHMMYKWKLHTT